MAEYIDQSDVELNFIFNEYYVDNCHPNKANCTSNVTCTNCHDGFNPPLIVASYLITNGENPIDNAVVGTDIVLVNADELINFFFQIHLLKYLV